jgi:hypothetical protein
MSNSKARFQPNTSGSTSKHPPKSSVAGMSQLSDAGGYKTLTMLYPIHFSGSKTTVGTKTAVANAAGPAGKGSHIPAVPFNGKNLAPQSLIQRKSGGEGGHKKKTDRAFVDKNETIEEDEPDDNEKPVLPTVRAKR